jgi:hypothetical protein
MYYRQYVIGNCCINMRRTLAACEADDENDSKWGYRVSYSVDDYVNSDKPYLIGGYPTIENIKMELKGQQGL